jgi:hypothetical protein
MTGQLDLQSFQAAALRVCFDEEPDPANFAQLEGSKQRWMVYRKMVRNRLTGMIRAGLPRFTDNCEEDEIADLVQSFFGVVRVKSRYIRDCVPEFATFVRDSRGDELPAELCAYLTWDEAIWCVRHGDYATVEAAEFQFEAVPVVNPAHRDLELPTDPESDEGGKTFITVFRQQGTHRMRDMRMNGFARCLWEEIVASEKPIMASISSLAAAEGADVDHAFIQRVCDILAEFLDHGLLLGSRSERSDA